MQFHDETVRKWYTPANGEQTHFQGRKTVFIEVIPLENVALLLQSSSTK